MFLFSFIQHIKFLYSIHAHEKTLQSFCILLANLTKITSRKMLRALEIAVVCIVCYELILQVTKRLSKIKYSYNTKAINNDDLLNIHNHA